MTKIDLVMWTKNGERTLDQVLKRINKVVPEEVVNQRFIIDDQSTDNTVKIALMNGWSCFPNATTGISSGANTALDHVKAEVFCSFEQDVLICLDWWNKIGVEFLSSPELGAYSGMRFTSKPRGLLKLQKYVAKKYRGETELSSWLRGRVASAFTLGKTLDNTIYRTEAMRKIGGFPKLKTNAGVDTILAYSLAKAGYNWKVDYYVQSSHLRKGLFDELQHQYGYGQQIHSIMNQINYPINKWNVIYHLVISPLSGVFVAWKTKEPTILYIHPLIRFYYAWGLLKSG